MEKETKEKNKKSLFWKISGIGILVLAAFFTGMVLGIHIGDGQNAGADVAKQPTESQMVEVEETQASEMEILEIESLDSEELQESETLQIVMIGDMLMHDRIIESGLKEDGSYNFDHLFSNVKDSITEADIAIVNQEAILGGPKYGYTGYPSFNSPYELGDALVNAGFNVVLHATNHAMDKGKNAVLNCMDYWETNHPEIAYLGINRSQEAQDENIYVFEQDGMKVAILNYTYGTNGIPLPSKMPYLVNLMDEDKIRADIQKAEEIADFTIVCPHWGTEYNFGTDSSQEKWTQIFLEEGVDLVLGAHPHVIEPIEWVKDENGNEMLVYYSLGNFVNGTASTGHGVTNRMVGGIADVTIGRNEEGEVEIIEYGAVPIVCHVGYGTDYTVYYLDDYTEELAMENLILSQDGEFSKALCESIFNQVWGE